MTALKKATAKTNAKATADPYGMTNKRAYNDRSRSLRDDKQENRRSFRYGGEDKS
jgi:hypothetical protein